MNKIGLPEDNMFLISAGRIKALILEEKALDLVERSVFRGQNYPGLLNVYNSNNIKFKPLVHKKNIFFQLEIVKE